jgi:hypothetical protein
MVLGLLIAAVASAAPASTVSSGTDLPALLQEESPDVFLAKAALQQYLSRIVRKDWDAARRLTHPKTRSSGPRARDLWSRGDDELKTFHFTAARQVAPGVVVVEVGEDTWRADDDAMSTDEAAVYMLFKSRGGFLVGDRRPGVTLADVSDHSVRSGYPGYVDGQMQAQARRESAIRSGRHR